MNCRLAMLLVLLMSVFALGSGFALETIDISGTYETTHPREETGKVFVCFERTQSKLVYDGVGYPAYDVSVWKPGDEHVRKLRDGLFETYTTAAVYPGEHGWVLLWYSPDEDDFAFNKIIRVDSHGSLSIGSQDPSSGDHRTYNVLRHVGDRVDLDELRPENLTLEGVYRYFHSATGNVYVGFEKTGDTMTVSRGVEIDAYSVTVLSKVGELGYSPVRDGLYGGSFVDDSFPLVGVHADDDGQWLIWKNPEAPRRIRRNRIVSVYPNGDIGIGLDEGELKYVEDTVFQRVAGPDARIGGFPDFIDLEGSYAVRLGESESEAHVRISPTQIVRGNTPGEPAVYRISTVGDGSGDAPAVFDGLFDGDPFTHVAVITRDGRGYFVWHSFSLQTTEENLIFDLDAEGSFLLVGGEFGERYVVAEFRKTPSSLREDAHAEGVGTLPPADDDDVETRIRAVESRSCLTVTWNQENPWTPAEIDAMREVLTLLPPGLRFQKPISVARDGPTYLLGESPFDLVEISLSPRELRIRNFQTTDTFGEPPDSFHRTYLKRSLIQSLARFYYDELPPDQKREWRSFALWSPGLFSPTYAENTNPAGYASEQGMDSPELDFATYAVEFFMPSDFKDPMNQVRYRLPDRYTFFCELFEPTELFASTPEAHQTQTYVRSVRDWIDPDDVEHIELIVTTPTASAAESLAGHLLLLVKRNGDYHDGRDSLVLGFVGVTSLDTNNGVAGVTYAWRGLTGHYQSAIQEETFENVVQRATVLENRDVQRFRLNLSQEETIRLVERIWVIQNTFTYQYRFFGVNCASMLFDALNHAFSDGEKITLGVPLVPPLYVVAALEQGGRLGGAIYPEYWSIGKTARYATAKNAKIQAEVLDFLRRKAHQSESLPMEVHDEVRSLFALLLSVGTAQVGTDQLWREPILETGRTGRADAYARLSSLFVDIRREYVGHGRAITPQEYTRLAELLLRFFMNAYSRELYIAVPTEIKNSYSEANPIPTDISREFVQEQLQEIQLRNRNSKEIQSLRRALSSFRISLENTYPDASMYVIGREMQSEANAELAAARSDIAWTHGYYPTEFSLDVQNRRTGNSIAMGFDAALFSEDLGHNSIFALKEDMRMVLLSIGASARIGIDGGSLSWGQGRNFVGLRGTLFDFQKVLTGDDVDYTGFFSHGFGFTLLDGSVEVPDDTRQIADAHVCLRPLELRYVLNIFEVDGFRHFLNLSAGPAYLHEQTDGTGDHLFGFPLEAEGKFHTGGNLENSFRFCVQYEPLLSVGGVLSHSLSGSTEFSWAPRNRPYSIRYAGAEMSLRLQSPAEGVSSMDPDLRCYIRLR